METNNYLKLHFYTGTHELQTLYLKSLTEIPEHNDFLKLIDNYFSYCKDNNIKHNFKTFALNEIKEDIGYYLPINGGEFYINELSHITYLTEDELLDKLTLEALRKSKNLYLKEEKDKEFHTELYAYYDDYLSDKTIQEILNSKDPMGKFCDIMFECYENVDFDERDGIEVAVKEYITENYSHLELDLNFSEITLNDILLNYLYVDYPYDHYLNQEVRVNIKVDTGDCNYDFTCNNLLNYYAQNYKFPKDLQNESSLLHLAKWQGYTKLQFVDFMFNDSQKHPELKDNKFLKSLKEEAENLSSHMGALIFLCEMTLRELIELNTDSEGNLKKDRQIITDLGNITDKNKKYPDLKISKTTMCGLFDSWQGSGSLLDIELEKDFILKSEYIFDICFDQVNDVYGLIDRCWTRGKVEIIKEEK